MDRANGIDQDGVSVAGFEVPTSPVSSYNNSCSPCDDDEPPILPSHLRNTLLSFPTSQDDSISAPVPHHAILNHLYIENIGGPRSVVALGTTHRFRSKYVTVVLYKPR